MEREGDLNAQENGGCGKFPLHCRDFKPAYPQAVVLELIGHDSEQMSQHYTHVGMEALKKAADALPDLTAPQT